MTLDDLISEHGKTIFNGSEYVFLQDAYATGPVDAPYYTAAAIAPANGPDEDGMYQVYELTWYPLQSWLDGDREDEGDACDWDSPDDVSPLGGCGYDLESNRII